MQLFAKLINMGFYSDVFPVLGLGNYVYTVHLQIHDMLPKMAMIKSTLNCIELRFKNSISEGISTTYCSCSNHSPLTSTAVNSLCGKAFTLKPYFSTSYKIR